MNVLEKILEEIGEKIKSTNNCSENLAFIDGIQYGLAETKKIIRSHIEDGKDTNVPSNWIPVEERLPDEHDSTFAIYKGTHLWSKSMFEKISDLVNVTYELEDRTRKTGTSYTLDGKWKIEKDRVVKKKVVAWQSLPEEYKGD